MRVCMCVALRACVVGGIVPLLYQEQFHIQIWYDKICQKISNSTLIYKHCITSTDMSNHFHNQKKPERNPSKHEVTAVGKNSLVGKKLQADQTLEGAIRLDQLGENRSRRMLQKNSSQNRSLCKLLKVYFPTIVKQLLASVATICINQLNCINK